MTGSQQMIFDAGKAVRRDGAAQQFTKSPLSDLLPGVSQAQAEPVETQRLAIAGTAQASAEQVIASEGKGDIQVVNREGKGSLLSKTVANQN